MTVEEIPTPEPGKGQVLLRVLRAGICGSDLHARVHADATAQVSAEVGYDAFMRSGQSVVMGHEFAGEVVSYGPGCRKRWAPGTPVLISDHLNLTGRSPLEGATFQDLTDLYSSRLRDLARTVDPSLPEGVYAQFPGPHYETPAEVRMAGVLGADLVGMSTALEAIAARHAGLEVLGLSLVTNLAAGIQQTPLSHQEVVEAGQAAGPRIAELLARIAGEIR